jgi:hypothetical protein
MTELDDLLAPFGFRGPMNLCTFPFQHGVLGRDQMRRFQDTLLGPLAPCRAPC